MGCSCELGHHRSILEREMGACNNCNTMCARKRSRHLGGMRVGAQLCSRACALKAACAQERSRHTESARAR
eukprot:4465235-Alexandrium_andersonii.AAC.1